MPGRMLHTLPFRACDTHCSRRLLEMARILPTVTHRKGNGVDLTEIAALRIAKRLRYAAGG